VAENNRIDFAKLKANVPIGAVLGHYGVQTKRRNDTYLVAKCPLPAHSSAESKSSFSVNTEKNLWTCHSDSCKKGSGMRGGDVIDLVCLMEGYRSPMDGAKRLADLFPQHGVEPVNDGPSAVPVPSAPTAPPVPVQNKPLGFALKDVNPEHPVIQARGISVETAGIYGAGFFPGKGSMAGRIVFPLFENGALVGYAGRTVGEVSQENPKWKLPAGLVKSFVYGLERCDPTKLLILTESFWAPLWFYQRGAQAASLMGTDLTEQQEKALTPFGAICIAFDRDEKGREATERIASRLRGKHKITKATLVE
jgi:DNA primase